MESASQAPLGSWWTRVTPDWATFVNLAEIACGDGSTSGNAFRGQSNCQFSLRPSLLRLVMLSKLAVERALDIERRISTEFAAHEHLYAISPSEPIQGTVAWWPWMQHYGAPTRLLDWSLSPYVALYFAVERDWEHDGVVWGFAVNELRRRMSQQFGCENATVDPKLRSMFDSPTAPPHVSVVSSERYSERMSRQQGLFTLCTNIMADHADAIGGQLPGENGVAHSFKFVVPRTAKPDFLRRLRRLNITALSLFPGPDGLGRSLGELVRLGSFGN